MTHISMQEVSGAYGTWIPRVTTCYRQALLQAVETARSASSRQCAHFVCVTRQHCQVKLTPRKLWLCKLSVGTSCRNMQYQVLHQPSAIVQHSASSMYDACMQRTEALLLTAGCGHGRRLDNSLKMEESHMLKASLPCWHTPKDTQQRREHITSYLQPTVLSYCIYRSKAASKNAATAGCLPKEIAAHAV